MINLEELFDGSPSDRNFQTLRRLVPDAGGISLGFRVGVQVCTWPGGDQQTDVPTVTHGLGRVPAGVFVSVMDTPVASVWTWSNAADADSFIVSAQTSEAAPAGGTECTVAWLVIG